MRLPLTILLGALIIGGVVGVVGIKMQPNYDESRLQPIIVDAPRSFAPTVPPVPPKPSLAAPTPQPAAPIAPPVDTNGVPAPPPALEHVQPTDDGGHHRGGDDRGGDDDGDDDGGGNDNGGHGGNSVPGDTSYVAPHRRLRDRLRPFAARTRIIGWVLLLVIAALGIVTFVTWRLLISATDARMHSELRFEIQQFTELAAPGVNPRTGAPFTGVDEVIREAIAYNVAKPNEKFVGYVDGQYRAQSRQQAPAPQASLARDAAFTRLVAPLTSPAEGRYHHPDIGEVLYVAVPVTLSGDPARGVITAAYLADAERTGADEAARLMLIVGAATMLGAVGAAWLVAGRILRPLRDITETARTITDTDLSGRIPWRGGDELGGLVATVNGMLDRVETGVAAQRRFIDDAGHELRTPITIIRGHLEVLNPADPADVESTVSLVDDELERMNRMVSDLLLLAQSEQPAFLRLQPVDVAALTRDVFDKVALLGDRDFELEATAEVQATLDPQRITQALVALADNACRYTEPGDRIAVGSMLDRGWLRFWIADSGRGVSDQDRSHIFERFSRGGAASQRSDGAGLGLAIVRAIAVAHGGDVLLDSIPGRGSTFTVVVPRMRAGEPWPES